MAAWERALEQLDERGHVARAAVRRVQDLKETQPPDGPKEARAWEERRTRAVAISQVATVDYLRAARSLMAQHLAAGSPSGRLPRAVIPPRPMRRWWQEHLASTSAGVWRYLPVPAPEEPVDGAAAPGLVEAVRTAAVDLAASHRGHRAHPERMLKPVPGQPGRTAVPEDRLEEHLQAHTDRFAVWDRARTYGDAVSALLRDQHGMRAQEDRSFVSAEARGIGRFVGHEDRLATTHHVPDIKTLQPEHWVAAAGWSLLSAAVMNAALQLTLQSYWLIDSPWPTTIGLSLVLALGVLAARAGIIRSWSTNQVRRAIAPGLAAAAALALWQATGPALEHYYPTPLERYSRELGETCLAGTPYAYGDAVISGPGDDEVMEIGSLTQNVPILRLGPAGLGSTEPLRALNEQSQEILRQHGCN
jgi:hypothetical protein